MKSLRISFLILSSFCFGQQLQTAINKDTIQIGERIDYVIVVPLNGNPTVEFPSKKDSLAKNIEVLENRIDTIKTKTGTFLQNRMQITSFESGNYLLKTLPVIINQDTIRTESFKIYVEEVVLDKDDQVFPIKPIIEEKFTLIDYLRKYWIYLAVIAGIFIISLVVLILFLTRKKKKKFVKPKTPYEEAIFGLKELDKKKYLESNNLKPYYSELVFILKRYFGKRFEFNALKFLSYELVEFFKSNKEIDLENCKKMHQFFDDADSVKYAKGTPAEYKHKEYRQLVEQLIEQTKPIVINEDDEVFNQRKNSENV